MSTIADIRIDNTKTFSELFAGFGLGPEQINGQFTGFVSRKRSNGSQNQDRYVCHKEKVVITTSELNRDLPELAPSWLVSTRIGNMGLGPGRTGKPFPRHFVIAACHSGAIASNATVALCQVYRETENLSISLATTMYAPQTQLEIIDVYISQGDMEFCSSRDH